MPSDHSIRRLARLAKKVQTDLRRGGMAINFRMMFRSTSTLTRVVALLSEQVARLSSEVDALREARTPPSARPPVARSRSETTTSRDRLD